MECDSSPPVHSHESACWFFIEGFTLDQKDLTDMGEVEVRIERRTAPHAPRFNASVIGRCDLDKVGGAALLGQPRDIAMQRRLVALGGEVIRGLSFDDIGCQCALGQQGIARDILAGEVTVFQQGDRHADLIGALECLTARYG